MVDLIVSIYYCFFFFFIMLMISKIIKMKKRNKVNVYFQKNVVKQSESNPQKIIYKDVSKSDLQRFNSDDINQLKDFFYDLFVQFENSYNNLDFGLMRELSTDQLYENYYTGLTLDLNVGKKKIVDKITRKNVIIYGLDSTINKQVACLMIEISYISYTLNKEGYVIKGNRDVKKTEKFDVTFRKDFDKKEIHKCPNCGANVENGKCNYCKSVLKNNTFKISSIKKIIEE